MENKKVHRLSRQLILMTILLFIIGTVAGAFALYKGSRDLYLRAKNDMIERDLKSLREKLNTVITPEFLFDYCRNHDDYTQIPTIEEDEMNSEYNSLFYSEYEDTAERARQIKKFSPEIQRLAAADEYYQLTMNLSYQMLDYDYEKLYCIDISEDNCGLVLYDAVPAEREGGFYAAGEEKTYWDYSAKDHPALKEIRDGADGIVFEITPVNKDSDHDSYIGYLPLGDTGAALCISYDWTPIQRELIHKVTVFVVYILIGMLIICIMIMLFLRHIVLRPINTIQQAAREYMNEKDSSKATEKLAAVKVNNEIKVLSDDVGELTVEIDKYIDGIKNLTVEVMEALARTIDAKDKYTNGHSVRVAIYSRMIAKKMGLSKEEQENIYYMGLLHDIGKIAIPLEIINKPTRLTDEEYEIIKTHPIKGYEILSEIQSLPELTTGARWHHERYDGKGYPDGIAGEEIPKLARIIAVADSYDTMTSNRSYRKYLPQDVVRAEIEKNMGTQFDPVPAKVMLEIIDHDTKYMLHE